MVCLSLGGQMKKQLIDIAKNLPTQDPPNKLLASADELSESAIRVQWRFRGEHAQGLQAHPAEPTFGLHQLSAELDTRQQASEQQQQQPVDGFVLSYAKLQQRARAQSPPPRPSGVAQLPEPQPRLGDAQPGARQQQQQAPLVASGQALPASSLLVDEQKQQRQEQQQQQQWSAVQLAPLQRSHVLKNLDCGAWYAIKVWAFNRVGKGEPSDVITASTRGKGELVEERRCLGAK